MADIQSYVHIILPKLKSQDLTIAQVRNLSSNVLSGFAGISSKIPDDFISKRIRIHLVNKMKTWRRKKRLDVIRSQIQTTLSNDIPGTTVTLDDDINPNGFKITWGGDEQ